MGWSNAAVIRGYSHVAARLRRDIAERLDTYLWAPNETRTADKPSLTNPE